MMQLKIRRFSSNPLVVSDPDIRFYAGAPLVTSKGEAIGTICVIDRQPREITVEQIEALKILSREIMVQLELRRSINSLEKNVLAQEQYVEQLHEHNRTMEKIKLELEAQLLIDPLTGIYNRRAFDLKFEEEFLRAGRYSGDLSSLILDVDYFKQYNDLFGHPAGRYALPVGPPFEKGYASF